MRKGAHVAGIYSIIREPQRGLQEAILALRRGGIVIFPTETFYGIAALPHDNAAIARLVELKSRLPHKPMPLIASDRAACARAAVLPAALEPLCAAFWPGPLTLVLAPQDSNAWPQAITGPTQKLGIRVSSHPVAQALAAACGGIITSTSANFATVAAVTDCAALDPALVAQVDVVLDAGALPGGLPSTVLHMDAGAIKILRPGAVTLAQIERVVRP